MKIKIPGIRAVAAGLESCIPSPCPRTAPAGRKLQKMSTNHYADLTRTSRPGFWGGLEKTNIFFHARPPVPSVAPHHLHLPFQENALTGSQMF